MSEAVLEPHQFDQNLVTIEDNEIVWDWKAIHQRLSSYNGRNPGSQVTASYNKAASATRFDPVLLQHGVGKIKRYIKADGSDNFIDELRARQSFMTNMGPYGLEMLGRASAAVHMGELVAPQTISVTDADGQNVEVFDPLTLMSGMAGYRVNKVFETLAEQCQTTELAKNIFSVIKLQVPGDTYTTLCVKSDTTPPMAEETIAEIVQEHNRFGAPLDSRINLIPGGIQHIRNEMA